ncbi:MAG: SDR family NAD(P)-dependent oxidoreductase [Alphaproteobacteria bacterium]|nr:SDR family NAD(P)-dependent oxidoreductase [Alphaproteobacteria bacterium]
MSEDLRPLAVVTGASSGIGYELAKLCAENGHDLVIAADRPEIVEAADAFRKMGVKVEHLQVDLAERGGVDQLIDKIGERPVDVLMANAGNGLGHAFLDERLDDWIHVINTNVVGTLYLVQKVVGRMRDRGRGRVLFTGSIAGLMPGAFQAVYNGTKAFIDSFSFALRNELKDSGVTVTCLMPGATDTDFFERAGLQDTKIGQEKKEDPAKVAKVGYDSMMKGEGDVVSGLKNKFRATMAAVTPQSALAEMHRKEAAPGTGDQNPTSGQD